MKLDLQLTFADTLVKEFESKNGFRFEWCINQFYNFFVDTSKNRIYAEEGKFNIISLTHSIGLNTLSFTIHFDRTGVVTCLQLGYIDGTIDVCVWEYSKHGDFNGIIPHHLIEAEGH